MNKLLIKRYFLNISGIIFSRICGLGRDLVLTGFFGAGAFSDLFFIMLRLPQIFRSLLTEGVFNQAFLPHLRAAPRKGKFVAQIFIKMLLICLVICILISIFSPQITAFLFPGLGAQMPTAAMLCALCIWFLCFNFCAQFLASICNYLGQFFWPSFLNSFFNIAAIASLATAGIYGQISALKICAAAISISSILQTLVLAALLRKNRLFKAFLASFATLLKQPLSLAASRSGGFFASLLASIAAAASAQINSLVEFFFASSFGSAAITHIQIVSRLYQLPLALIAIAFSQVFLPAILRAAQAPKQNPTPETAAATAGQNPVFSQKPPAPSENPLFSQKPAATAAEQNTHYAPYFYSLFCLLFAAAFFGYTFAQEIINLLFLRGSFGPEAAAATATLLRSYIWIILPLGLSKVFLSHLAANFAQKKAATISAASVLLNAALLYFLLPRYGLQAFAIAACGSASFVFCGYAAFCGRLVLLSTLRHKFALFAPLFCAAVAIILTYIKGWLDAFI